MQGGEKHISTTETIIKAWASKKAVSSPIKGLDSYQYSLRILDILKNELNVYSTSLNAAALGLYCYFYDEKIKGLDSVIDKIAEDYLLVSRLPKRNIAKQANDYRSMLLNVAGDLRAVLISLAESILALRYYQKVPEAQQQTILDLNKHVYIPVAHRLGFYKIKSGMEDLVLLYEQPVAYHEIKSKLKETEKDREQIISGFIKPINGELKAHGLKFQIKGRTKSIFSIYSKITSQKTSFENVFDLWAIRIIIDSQKKDEKADCWHAYSVVTNLYTPSLARLRDWISVPRENGYESLHITVATENINWVEVQIRTLRMDDNAENGMAAHWRYKGGKSRHNIDFWLDNIKKALEQKDELLGEEDFRTGKFTTELFAFTPQGDLKKLNLGASVLDFAFAIHTEVGSKCVGGIVNGKNVGMKHLLRNGDQVNILTSKNQKPSLDWLNIVSSTRAKNRIRKAIDVQGKHDAEQGKEVLLRRLKNWKLSFNQDVLEKLASHFDFKSIGDLYRAIYLQKLDLLDIKRVLTAKEEKPMDMSSQNLDLSEAIVEHLPELEEEPTDILVIDQLDNINFSLAKCCHPIPGDKIFGFVTVSKGISIHRSNCPNASDMKQRYPYRIISTLWKAKKEKSNFRAELFVKGIDNTGIYGEISTLISHQLGIHILSINLNSNGNEFQGKLVIKIFDLEQLEIIIKSISELRGVIEVYRFA